MLDPWEPVIVETDSRSGTVGHSSWHFPPRQQSRPEEDGFKTPIQGQAAVLGGGSRDAHLGLSLAGDRLHPQHAADVVCHDADRAWPMDLW